MSFSGKTASVVYKLDADRVAEVIEINKELISRYDFNSKENEFFQKQIDILSYIHDKLLEIVSLCKKLEDGTFED